ncbi:DUF418 domain-containing protein [Filimonas effusa]|uniref:DUF418 domain-containing protein n=1 Tax=Filimonas effusa TaxID=2508721 RepID=A0A4Q1DFB5_9BACT|nr:DUF418 domain-containing protein [Filimonas effusa]RXK87329.1 DUF418 domain-containing protein [Filimonas effusa]
MTKTSFKTIKKNVFCCLNGEKSMAPAASQNYHANSLDILKGIGLFALLLMNCNRWFVAVPLPADVYGLHNSTADIVISQFIDYFISGQWYGFLAFLLGVQFFNSSKRESRQQRTDYFRRYLILLLIGVLHQVIWTGDILIIYALAGMLAVLLEKKGANVALMIGLLCCTNLPGFFASLFLQLIHGKPPEHSASAAAENAGYISQLMTNGGIKQFIAFNIDGIGPKYKYSLLTGQLFRIVGFYVLGYYAGRINFMQQVKDKARLTGIVFMGCLFCFLSLLYLQASLFAKQGSDLVLDPVRGMVSNMQYVFGTASYLLGLLLLLQFYRFRQAVQVVAPSGHIWLSAYLFQTLTGLLLFYPIGFGLYPDTGPLQNLLIAVGLFLLQIVFGALWLRYFYYGPVEWLWRSGAAYRWRRMRRADTK